MHRDIKPGNIMIAVGGKCAVLTDLGLAMEGVNEGALTRESTLIGTPLYASPEQLQGNQERIDCRSDVYSLGATLWEVLALRPLRKAGGIAEMIARALS